MALITGGVGGIASGLARGFAAAGAPVGLVDRSEAVEARATELRLVVVEFPGVERARAWLDSPEDAPARQMRRGAARSIIIVVEGHAPA